MKTWGYKLEKMLKSSFKNMIISYIRNEGFIYNLH